jgi:hypothetical protein
MPCQSDSVFYESSTVALSQIDDKVFGPLRFECADPIRRSQKEFANLEHEMIREFCRGFLFIQKPDQFFKNPSILCMAIQDFSFIKGGLNVRRALDFYRSFYMTSPMSSTKIFLLHSPWILLFIMIARYRAQ